jgi:uncharacterized protein YpmB
MPKGAASRWIVFMEIVLLLIVLLAGGLLWWRANHRVSDSRESTIAATSSETGSIRLAWDKPDSSRIVRYKILFGTRSKEYTSSVIVDDDTHVTLTGLPKGTTYYAVAIAMDSQGNESAPSEELEFVVPP